MLAKIFSLLTGKLSGYLLAGQAIAIFVLAFVISHQGNQISGLKDWRGDVLFAIGDALDNLDKKGAVIPTHKSQAVSSIAVLGRFKDDVEKKIIKAKADDLENVVRVQVEARQITQETLNEFEQKIRAANARADQLRNTLADVGGMHHEGSVTADNIGGGGGAHLPCVPSDSITAAQEARDNRFSIDTRNAITLTIKEREIATEQAIQLDALITTIEKIQMIDLKGEQDE